MLENIEATDSLLMSLFFGFIAVLFTIIPLSYSIAHSIYEGRSGLHQAKEFSILQAAIKSVFWHIGGCIVLMLFFGIIESLVLNGMGKSIKDYLDQMWNITPNLSDLNINGASVADGAINTSDGTEQLHAAVYALSVFSKLFYGCLPIFFIILVLVVAYRASVNRPFSSFLSRFWDVFLAVASGTFVIILWSSTTTNATYGVIDPIEETRKILLPESANPAEGDDTASEAPSAPAT